MRVCWITAELETSLSAEAAKRGLLCQHTHAHTHDKEPRSTLPRRLTVEKIHRHLTPFFVCVSIRPPGDDAMTGDTDKYLAPQDLRELGDDSLPQEGYMGFSVGARSQR